MRRTSIISYDHVDVQKIVKNELEKAKFTWLDEFTKIVAGFKDEVMTKLDKFVGEIQSQREEQTLHQNQHDTLKDTLKGYDIRLKKLEHPVL
jgi:gas vesicle protein